MKFSISIKRTAHYHVQFPKQEPDTVLYVIHGYAQLASEFIQTFKSLQNSRILVIAPEGISKFYNKNRKPVASWMTSHEREDEMRDYVEYLNQLYAYIKQQYKCKKQTILGFSQGVSTAFRWFSSINESKLQLYACSGSIPPELNAKNFKNEAKRFVYYYYGQKDSILPYDKAIKQVERIKALKLNYKSYSHDGGHEVPEICISHILNESQ